jgi:SAM-dependent methyltransferase
MKTEFLDECAVCCNHVIEVLDADCNIVKCTACGFIFDNPRPTQEELVRFYSQPSKYDLWLTELGPRETVWKRRLRMLLPYKKPGSLLDVGTGIGQFLSLARKSFTQVFGTEVSTTAVKIAKDRFQLDLFQGSIEDLEEAGSTFDNITLFHVLEHVPNPRLTIETCHSLLSPGGMLVIAVPNEIASLRTFVRRSLNFLGLRKQDGLGKFGVPRIELNPSTPEVHLSHFTRNVLLTLLKTTGFSVAMSTLDPYRLKTGLSRLKPEAYYYFCLGFLRIFQINLFDTIFVVAHKNR